MSTNISDKPINHEGWSQEGSLTAPADRDMTNKWKPNQGAPKLSEEEVSHALEENVVKDLAKLEFPKVERLFRDPPVRGQDYALLSFVPAKGAKPNENDVYGFVKVRGSYSNDIEIDERCEYLIRNVDSYNKIQVGPVGFPLPLTVSSKYAAESSEIDIRNEMKKSVSDDIKKKRQEEKNTIDEIKEREKKMLEDSKKVQEGIELDVEPIDEYITLCVKKAQLSWTYLEHIKKMKEVRAVIQQTRETVAKMDEKHPELKEQYMEKYTQARKDAGIEETSDEADKNFITMMSKDQDLPGIDSDFSIAPSDIFEKTSEFVKTKTSGASSSSS